MGRIVGAIIALLSLALFNPAKAETASWYHEGTRTANGEKFNPDGLTAAHRSLPFGTIVQVTNLANGRSVVVRINDRGPAKWTGKDIDLSRGAARQIGMIEAGVARVSIVVLR